MFRETSSKIRQDYITILKLIILQTNKNESEKKITCNKLCKIN